MRKYLVAVLLIVGALAACDVPDLTSSGGDSVQTFASAGVPGAETVEAAGSSPEKPGEAPQALPPVAPPPVVEIVEPEEPDPPVAAGNCGAGHYEFRTDSDNKFHFDAHFETGGLIRYNFSVQPNTGRWRVSGNQMIFNGPFGAGASNHVSSWTITSRAADCTVLQFRGKSYGQADVTASRL
jgi:hypothetical protein